MTRPLWFKLAYGYAALLAAFSALMVGMSIFSPDPFFAGYGVQGDAAFQYSWSFRYMTILLVMVAGLILRSFTGVFVVILARFFVDAFDVIGILIYNTPPFSLGSMGFLLCALILPQIIFLRFLLPKVWNDARPS